MNISQPTFHRVLSSARKKLAEAIVNSKAIKIEYTYKIPNYIMYRGFGGRPTKCICPKCGYEEEKTIRVPCRNKKCPKCGIPLIRGD